MPPDRARIARNLRDARENRRITQQAAARHVGISRSLVAQIELGNRDASAEELAKLASLYELAVVDLVGADVERGDDVLLSVLDRAPEFLEPATKRQLEAALALFRRARFLGQELGRLDVGPPLYGVASARSVADAITQGERLAQEERLRLGLGSQPIGDLAWLATTTGANWCAVDLPDDVVGLSLRTDAVGIALMVDRRQDSPHLRYVWAQQYAHTLITRGPAVAITKRSNARELAQVRAAAFASAFLLQPSGIAAWLARADKGQPSRRPLLAYGVADDAALRAEVRFAPGSQTLGFHDAAGIARTFGAPYKAVVHRLVGLGFLSEADSSALLRPKAAAAADRLLALSGGHPAEGAFGGFSDVRVEIVDLAIEAYRRGADKAALSGIARQVELPGLPAERLIELAEAAR